MCAALSEEELLRTYTETHLPWDVTYVAGETEVEVPAPGTVPAYRQYMERTGEIVPRFRNKHGSMA